MRDEEGRRDLIGEELIRGKLGVFKCPLLAMNDLHIGSGHLKGENKK